MSPQDEDAQNPPAVVVDASDATSTSKSFFSFAEPGKVTWWSLVIVGLLGSLTLASIIIIAVKSGTRSPPLAFAAVKSAQCPYVSPLLPVVAYTAWMSTCPDASFGQAVACETQVDCAWLAGACATSDVVGQLRCAVPTLGVTSLTSLGQPQKVCAIAVSGTPVGASASSGGFCTTPNTQCAVCGGDGACDSGLSGCVPSSACAASNSSGGWLCLSS